jgi:hypothetical protein
MKNHIEECRKELQASLLPNPSPTWREVLAFGGRREN